MQCKNTEPSENEMLYKTTYSTQLVYKVSDAYTVAWNKMPYSLTEKNRKEKNNRTYLNIVELTRVIVYKTANRNTIF
jgi:hypothetical protein